MAAVRAAIHEVDPAQPLVNLRTMDAALAGTVAQPHLQMVLLILFALLALVPAVVGVYGVMAYVVTQRIPEIGIRMAVGASRGRVVGLLVWEGARLAMTGIAIGTAASMAAERALTHLVSQVQRPDAVTFVAAAAALGLAAVAASTVPAIRAARISPFRAINH